MSIKDKIRKAKLTAMAALGMASVGTAAHAANPDEPNQGAKTEANADKMATTPAPEPFTAEENARFEEMVKKNQGTKTMAQARKDYVRHHNEFFKDFEKIVPQENKNEKGETYYTYFRISKKTKKDLVTAGLDKADGQLVASNHNPKAGKGR